MRDIKLDSDFAPVIEDGDFAETDNPIVTDEHLIMLCGPGNFRRAPLCGLGILKNTNARTGPTERAQLRARIDTQLRADGLVPTQIDVTADSQGRLNITLRSSRPQPR